jgi:hypothetical protein
MEQTALEWFHKETWNLKDKLENKLISIGKYANTYHELYNQAKEMENQQMKKMYLKGIENYDQTFKQQEK